MYTCKDCNTKYEYKPQYCDCGSNAFDKIVTHTGKKIDVGILVIFIILAILPWVFDIPKNIPNNSSPKTHKQLEVPEFNEIWKTNHKQFKQQVPIIIKTDEIFQPKAIKKILPPTIQKKVQKPKPIIKQQTKEIDPKTLEKYKNSLGATLLSKLNLLAIYGSGECSVEFSLNKEGKLLNRKFVQKSENTILNDEVYLMLMRLPIFKAPPVAYHGEKIKIKVIFDNGYYELSVN